MTVYVHVCMGSDVCISNVRLGGCVNVVVCFCIVGVGVLCVCVGVCVCQCAWYKSGVCVCTVGVLPKGSGMWACLEVDGCVHSFVK